MISQWLFCKICSPCFWSAHCRATTEFLVYSPDYRLYATNFPIVVDDLETWRPASVGDSSEGRRGLGILFRQQREQISSTWVVGQVGPFCHIWFIWILTKKTLEFWKIFFTNDLKISSSFLHIILFFFEKWIWIPKFNDFWIHSGPNPPNFRKVAAFANPDVDSILDLVQKKRSIGFASQRTHD
jgi:hypothetical protein